MTIAPRIRVPANKIIGLATAFSFLLLQITPYAQAAELTSLVIPPKEDGNKASYLSIDEANKREADFRIPEFRGHIT